MENLCIQINNVETLLTSNNKDQPNALLELSKLNTNLVQLDLKTQKQINNELNEKINLYEQTINQQQKQIQTLEQKLNS